MRGDNAGEWGEGEGGWGEEGWKGGDLGVKVVTDAKEGRGDRRKGTPEREVREKKEPRGRGEE